MKSLIIVSLNLKFVKKYEKGSIKNMIKIKVNKATAEVTADIKKGDAAVEVVTVIMALADAVGKDNTKEFKKLLRTLIEDENSPLNDPERYMEGENE